MLGRMKLDGSAPADPNRSADTLGDLKRIREDRNAGHVARNALRIEIAMFVVDAISNALASPWDVLGDGGGPIAQERFALAAFGVLS